MKKIIMTDKAPAAIGPYSQGVVAGNTLYISGQLPINPSTGKLVGESIKSQTKQSLENAIAILAEAGYEMKDVVKTTVLLSDINNFKEMNEVYSEYFTSDFPARAAYQIAKLPLGALVEIELIAVKK